MAVRLSEVAGMGGWPEWWGGTLTPLIDSSNSLEWSKVSSNVAHVLSNGTINSRGLINYF